MLFYSEGVLHLGVSEFVEMRLLFHSRRFKSFVKQIQYNFNSIGRKVFFLLEVVKLRLGINELKELGCYSIKGITFRGSELLK